MQPNWRFASCLITALKLVTSTCYTKVEKPTIATVSGGLLVFR
jgi:hypothetical protein